MCSFRPSVEALRFSITLENKCKLLVECLVRSGSGGNCFYWAFWLLGAGGMLGETERCMNRLVVPFMCGGILKID